MSKIHIYIDPEVPIFIATGITKKLLHEIKVSDIGDINYENGHVTINIGEETYLAALLRMLWDRYSKDRVLQPDRFTILMDMDETEAKNLSDLVVIDPTETLYKDLIYSMQVICPEGFKVRKQRFSEGKFFFIASENTLEEDVMPLVKAKFALMEGKDDS